MHFSSLESEWAILTRYFPENWQELARWQIELAFMRLKSHINVRPYVTRAKVPTTSLIQTEGVVARTPLVFLLVADDANTARSFGKCVNFGESVEYGHTELQLDPSVKNRARWATAGTGPFAGIVRDTGNAYGSLRTS